MRLAGRHGQAGALVALILVASTLQVTAGRAESASPGAVVLDDAAGVGSWAGTFRDVAIPSEANLYGQPGVCEHLGCRESLVEVALPAGVWAGQPGGVQIAIDWAPHEEHDLDLYVYGPRRVAGRTVERHRLHRRRRSALRQAANGRYRVVVVPQLVKGAVDYRGFVEVERDPASRSRPAAAAESGHPARPQPASADRRLLRRPRERTAPRAATRRRWPSRAPGAACASTR